MAVRVPSSLVLMFINEHSTLVTQAAGPGSVNAALWLRFAGLVGGFPNVSVVRIEPIEAAHIG